MESDQIVAIVISVLSILFVIFALFVRMSRRLQEFAKPKSESTSISPASREAKDSASFNCIFDYDANGTCGRVTKVQDSLGWHEVADMKCPGCGKPIPQFELKCVNCGRWLDNDVFQLLSEKDKISVLKHDLIITTPSLISMQNAAFSKAIQKEYEGLSDKIKTDTSALRLSLYLLYCFADALNVSAQKKSGRGDFLHDAIYNTLITDFGTLLNTMESPPFKGSLDSFENLGMSQFRELDGVWHGETLAEISPASMFVAAEMIGRIVAPNEASIPLNLALFRKHLDIFNRYSDRFSEYFIVENGDFSWARLIETKKAVSETREIEAPDMRETSVSIKDIHTINGLDSEMNVSYEKDVLGKRVYSIISGHPFWPDFAVAAQLMGAGKLDDKSREELRRGICVLYPPVMLNYKWPGWEIGCPRPINVVNEGTTAKWRGGGVILQKGFFKKVETGQVYCDYSEVVKKFGEGVEARIGKASGLHFNLERAYWTFNVKFSKWIEHNKKEHNCTLVCELDEYLAWFDAYMREAFFPTPGPAFMKESKRKELQEKVLKELAPDLRGALMNDIWGS